MTTDDQRKILDAAITAIRARAAQRAADQASVIDKHNDWYQLGAEHATERAVMEIEIIRDAW